MKKLLIILCAITLSSCALLDKLRGNHHVDGMLVVPPVVTEDIRG